MLPGVGWAGSLGAGWAAVVLWIAVLAWALLQLESSDAARGIPLGNLLRDQYTGDDVAVGDLNGFVAVVTGASSGLGLEVARLLAERGATVVLACRDLERAETAKSIIKAHVESASIDTVHLDLADLSSVRAAATEILKRYEAVHILVNNAGMTPPFPPQRTRDGIELTFQANYLGHFDLTRRLIPALRRAKSYKWAPRVVFLTSSLHRVAPREGVWLTLQEHNNFSRYDLSERYAVAKLACLVIAIEFDLRYGNEGIYFNAVHPGVVATRILRDPVGVATALAGPVAGPYLAPALAMGKRLRDALFAYSARRAAVTVFFAAASPKIKNSHVRGQYIVPEGLLWVANHPSLYNESQLVGLWDFSEELVGPLESTEDDVDSNAPKGSSGAI